MNMLAPYQKDICFVRQYARAVTSDQFVGDEIAAAALGKFNFNAIADLSERRRRIAIFQAFYETWRAARQTDQHAAAFSSKSVLAAGPFTADPARQLLLLVDVMGIDLDMAAELLKLPVAEARKLYIEERTRVRSQIVSGTALVIEDEPLIAMEVASTLESIGLTVVASARDANSAVKLAHQYKPDVVLADYDLGSVKTGLDAVKEIVSDIPVVAIFLTAYPDEVLRGDDYEPTFILTKPFDERAIRAAVVHGLSIPRREYVS